MLQLKGIIAAQRTEFPIERQLLLAAGKKLVDSAPLSTYNIKSGQTLYLGAQIASSAPTPAATPVPLLPEPAEAPKPPQPQAQQTRTTSATIPATASSSADVVGVLRYCISVLTFNALSE